jgi:hypothetical protein
MKIMTLRKTIDGLRGVYRIFESTEGAFHVLDSSGCTVDEFKFVAATGGVKDLQTQRASRKKPLALGVPDLARAFASDLRRARA